MATKRLIIFLAVIKMFFCAHTRDCYDRVDDEMRTSPEREERESNEIKNFFEGSEKKGKIK